MPALPDWKNFLTESDDATPIQAISPYTTPLDSFQIGHNIEWDFSPTFAEAALGNLIGMGIAFGNATGSFEFKILDGKTADAPVSFWQKVSLKFTWVALLFGGFLSGGLDFFSWSFTSEQIDTYIIDGAPTDKHPTTPDPDNPAYRYTIGGTEFSESGIAIPGGGPTNGNGVGILGGHISSFWQGPLYQNVNLPANAGLLIVNDYSRGSFVGTLPLWHIRAIAGEDEIDAYFQVFGPLNKSYGRSGAVYFSDAALPDTDKERGKIAAGSEPSINEDLRGVVYAGFVAPDGKVYEAESSDTGLTWRRRQTRADQTSETLSDLIVWGTGYNMPRFATLPDGNRGTVTYKNGAIWFKSSRDDFRALNLIATVPRQEAYELSVDSSGVLYVSSATRQEYKSVNNGDTWQKIENDAG